jgi:hypothetical protein
MSPNSLCCRIRIQARLDQAERDRITRCIHLATQKSSVRVDAGSDALENVHDYEVVRDITVTKPHF